MAFLGGYHIRAFSQWEEDLGPVSGDQWEDVLKSVTICSLNVSQKGSQIYIVYRAHYTAVKLHRLPDSLCSKCKLVPGNLIHLLWPCPKLHRYWTGVLNTLIHVFKTSIPLDPTCCILGALEGVIPALY